MMLKKDFQSFKIAGLIAVLAASLTLIQGCGVTDSGNSNEFVVPFEIVVPVSSLGGGRYNVSSASISASFPDRENATSYTFVVVAEDGTKSEPFTRRKHQLNIHNGVVRHGYMFDTPTFYFDVNQETKDALVKQLTEELQPRMHQYKELEVTVNE